MTTEVLEVNVPIAIVYRINVENFPTVFIHCSSAVSKMEFPVKMRMNFKLVVLVGYLIEDKKKQHVKCKAEKNALATGIKYTTSIPL